MVSEEGPCPSAGSLERQGGHTRLSRTLGVGVHFPQRAWRHSWRHRDKRGDGEPSGVCRGQLAVGNGFQRAEQALTARFHCRGIVFPDAVVAGHRRGRAPGALAAARSDLDVYLQLFAVCVSERASRCTENFIIWLLIVKLLLVYPQSTAHGRCGTELLRSSSNMEGCAFLL